MVTVKVTLWRCIQMGTEYTIAESNAEGMHQLSTPAKPRGNLGGTLTQPCLNLPMTFHGNSQLFCRAAQSY